MQQNNEGESGLGYSSKLVSTLLREWSTMNDPDIHRIVCDEISGAMEDTRFDCSPILALDGTMVVSHGIYEECCCLGVNIDSNAPNDGFRDRITNGSNVTLKDSGCDTRVNECVPSACAQQEEIDSQTFSQLQKICSYYDDPMKNIERNRAASTPMLERQDSNVGGFTLFNCQYGNSYNNQPNDSTCSPSISLHSSSASLPSHYVDASKYNNLQLIQQFNDTHDVSTPLPKFLQQSAPTSGEVTPTTCFSVCSASQAPTGLTLGKIPQTSMPPSLTMVEGAAAFQLSPYLLPVEQNTSPFTSHTADTDSLNQHLGKIITPLKGENLNGKPTEQIEMSIDDWLCSDVPLQGSAEMQQNSSLLYNSQRVHYAPHSSSVIEGSDINNHSGVAEQLHCESNNQWFSSTTASHQNVVDKMSTTCFASDGSQPNLPAQHIGADDGVISIPSEQPLHVNSTCGFDTVTPQHTISNTHTSLCTQKGNVPDDIVEKHNVSHVQTPEENNVQPTTKRKKSQREHKTSTKKARSTTAHGFDPVPGCVRAKPLTRLGKRQLKERHEGDALQEQNMERKNVQREAVKRSRRELKIALLNLMKESKSTAYLIPESKQKSDLDRASSTPNGTISLAVHQIRTLRSIVRVAQIELSDMRNAYESAHPN
eukprot:CFRG7593T1